MAGDPVNLYVPLGRYVSGDHLKKRTTNARNQPIPEDKQGYEFGVAINKTDPAVAQFFPQLLAAAKSVHNNDPNVAAVVDRWAGAGMQGFSMKVTDGDKPNLRGQVNQNTAGHFVIYLSTQSLEYVKFVNDQNVMVDPQTIKRGDYVDLVVQIKANGQGIGDGIGIYMNPVTIRHVGVGEAISGGMSLEESLALMPTAVAPPPGATAPGQIVTPQVGGMPGMAGAGMQQPPAGVPGMAGAGMQQPPAGAGVPGMAGAGMQQPGVDPNAGVPGMGMGAAQPPAGNPGLPQQQPGMGMGAAQPPAGVPGMAGAGVPGMDPNAGLNPAMQQAAHGLPGAPAGQAGYAGVPGQQTASPSNPGHPGIMPGNGGLPGV